MRICTGTRVPAKTSAPLTTSGWWDTIRTLSITV